MGRPKKEFYTQEYWEVKLKKYHLTMNRGRHGSLCYGHDPNRSSQTAHNMEPESDDKKVVND